MSDPDRRLRHLPNLLSALRLAAAPVLVALAMTGELGIFTVVLVPALVTDIADGYLARRLGVTSRFGALLDSLADLVLFAAAVFGVWCFHPELLLRHPAAGGLLITCWLVEPLVALLRYGRISSFHTYASKVAAYLLGFMVAALFLWGVPEALFYAAVGAGIAASIEEILLIAVLPQWRSDVRGLYWVLRESATVTT